MPEQRLDKGRASFLFLSYLLLALILGMGFYLRVDDLGRVQHFGGDSGRDYLVIMDWLQRGEWPLVGPWRSSGDYTIGPGWFYTIAPAIGLSGFDPRAGAFTSALIGMAAVWLAWWWVRQASGSSAAALITAAMLAFSFGLIENDRTLWNPQPLGFAMAALACLIEAAPHRPVATLFLFLMLAALIPQWHTTGIPLLVAATPFMGVALWQTRAGLRDAGLRGAESGGMGLRGVHRRRWRIWGALLALWLTALYLPPILYDLKPGPGNLAHYIENTLIPAAPVNEPILQRVGAAIARLVFHLGNMIGSWRLSLYPLRLWSAAGLVAGLSLIAWVLAVVPGLRGRRSVPLAATFLIVLLGGFWFIAFAKGTNALDYHFTAILMTPVMLGGWAAGRLLRESRGGRFGRTATRTGGLALLAVALACTARQLPLAWGIRQGEVWHTDTFFHDRRIAQWLVGDAAGRPCNMLMIEAPPNYQAHMIYLMRWLGNGPRNEDMFDRRVQREYFGEVLYLLTRGKTNDLAVEAEGLTEPLAPAQMVEDARVYRIATTDIPTSATALNVIEEGGRLRIVVK